jgi:hypothetical protein
MIQSISNKYKKHIAYPMLILFYLQTIILPLHAAMNSNIPVPYYLSNGYTNTTNSNPIAELPFNNEPPKKDVTQKPIAKQNKKAFEVSDNKKNESSDILQELNIGGPSSPEASSFKAVGSDNLVNLFTGDFSYSIPLLDVGGYPVNLFYNGGIGMEQEASWVGLGWNINPGTVSRSMRGVPDDFNGEDKLIQTQKVKPNRTWGAETGIDGEMIGIKKPKLNLTLGVSYNNYLGPAFELGAGTSVSIPLEKSTKDHKAVVSDSTSSLSLGISAKYSSRSGMSLSPSLNVTIPLGNKLGNIGAGLSTDYNSRTGLKELNFSANSSNSFSQTIKMGQSKATIGAGNIGGNASISFARPSYIPSLTMPMEYKNYSGQLEIGWTTTAGSRKSVQGQGSYSESKVPAELEIVNKPLIGFLYNEKAMGNPNAVMDFNRLNDAEVTQNTPILSAPQYNYDVFSIQGEGTGGSIRAYRGDLGFMKDNSTFSKDGNTSIGVDIGIPKHFGINWNRVKTPTYAGNWTDPNNTLNTTLTFKEKQNNTKFEQVYFRSPGETTVTNPELLDRIGRDNLVRFDLEGANANARLVPVLDQFNKNTPITSVGKLRIGAANLTERDKRTQVTTMLTAAEAAEIGVEKTIRNYVQGVNAFDTNKNIVFESIGRTDLFRKKHHISEISVLEQTGMRYVYGLPVYNTKQKDYNFSAENNVDPNTGIVKIAAGEEGRNSPHMSNGSKLDGYLMIQETPAYASSFLLTGLISPDFVDVTGNGITEDDLGNALKFDYTKSQDEHKWRTPRDNNAGNERSAHYSEGLRTKHKDNKANISYGQREVWYLHAIESKAMVAIFKTGDRDDAKGVKGELDGSVNTLEQANKKLERIDLYTKAEIKSKGYAAAIPIKTVHFTYSYALCKGTPDNRNISGPQSGKLTLEKVYFTYYNRERLNKDKYIFDYKYNENSNNIDNPNYAYQASDKWGTYKNPAINPSGLSNADHPFVSKTKASNDEFAAAWSLKRILLPSGGQMEVQYEAKDYAYVQNRKACDMFKLYGLGISKNAQADNSLYKQSILAPATLAIDYDYVYVEIPQAIQSSSLALQKQEIKEKYLLDIVNEQLLFKTFHNMPDGQETLNIYAEFDDYGVCANSPGKNIIYFKLKRVDGKSPLSRSAINFLIERLYGQAFPNSELDVNSLKDFLGIVPNMLVDMKNIFTSVDNNMRSQGKAQTIDLSKSFMRLANPSKIKYGGGQRVKKVIVKDNWNKMTKQYNSTYGQEYDYTTTDIVMGKDVTISSGVASYEPGLGSEENPFRYIVQYSDKLPLATAQYGAIEMPILDALYPAPGVGYSKVTVRSIHRKSTIDSTKSLRSAIGKQVTEFYTAKEYPTTSAYTSIDSRTYSRNSFFNVLYKDIAKRKTTSQGFLVETNDMHGKMKSQMAFSERDEKTPLSYSYHRYKNTGKNGLNDKVKFVHNELGGQVIEGNMGVDMELMTDTREHRVTTSNFNGQLQLDIFKWLPVPIFAIFFKPLKTFTENRYRAVACTKLINYHAIEDSVIVMDKGSIVSTKTIAYDAETGAAIVTKTTNEFKDPIYNVNYPAHWAYSGVGLAYKNINREFKNVNFRDGKIINSEINQNEAFESGDELYVTKQENVAPPPPPTPTPTITGTVGFACTVYPGSSGGGICSNKVTRLTFNFTNPTPQNLQFNVGEIFIPSSTGVIVGYGGGGVSFPSNVINITNNDIYSINIPAGVTTYTTPAIGIVSNNSPLLPCCNGYNSGLTLYVVDKIVLKVVTPINYISNIAGTTAGIVIVNDNPIVTPPPTAPILPCITSSPNLKKIWAYDTTKNSTPLTVQNKSFIFLDSAGNLFNKSNVTCRIVRSGKRNNLGLTVSGATCMKDPIQNGFLKIDNADKVVTASAVEYKEKWQVDNDVIKRYNYNYANCQLTEVEDCSGYLEKKINPYIKGLIGNLKPYRSYTYYGERNELSAATSTAIRKNGYLSNFSSYWNFNASTNNLVPATANTKWVWNSELTKVNSKGQELETKNALNIYTAAQYGFVKNQATAVANNSRVNEMFAESFEDSNYGEALNNGNYISSCTKKQIDFGSFVNANILGFNAHSGKNVLNVLNNTTFIKSVELSNPVLDYFGLNMKKDTTKSLIQQGSLLTRIFSKPNSNLFLTQGGAASVTISPNHDTVVNNLRGYEYNLLNSFYVYVPTSGIKQIAVLASKGNDSYIGGCDISCSLFDLNGNQINGQFTANSTSSSNANVTLTYNVCFTKGIYLVKCYLNGDGWRPVQGSFNGYAGDGFDFSINGDNTAYSSLSNAPDGCTYTNPIPATDSMLNPIFSPTPNKKMHFSAWVREGCTTTPCTKLNYADSKVQILLNNGTTTTTNITPTGSIIEGWQKVEGDFEIPIGSTTMTMNFINNGSTPNYWDDIRVHPYNANMKSYAYDPVTLRLSAELDENNYATFYEYDEEGQLIRVKKETAQGIKTIKETRSAKQQTIQQLVN